MDITVSGITVNNKKITLSVSVSECESLSETEQREVQEEFAALLHNLYLKLAAAIKDDKQLKELGERVAALEEKIKDGKTYVVTDGACDIDDIAEIVARRLNVQTLVKNSEK